MTIIINGITSQDYIRDGITGIGTIYGIPGWTANGNIDRTHSNGVIYYIPIFVPQTTTYTGIGMGVGTLAAATTCDLRVFNFTSNGVPGSLILSAGTVDVSTTGVKEIVINLTLNRGYYFLATRASGGAPQLTGPANSSAPLSGFASNYGQNVDGVVYTVTSAYTDPAPAPNNYVPMSWAAVFLKWSG